MAAKEFGRYLEHELREVRNFSLAYISTLIGEWPSGSRQALNEKAIQRLFTGERKLTTEFMLRLIARLPLDPDEAWARAGLLPPDYTAEDLRRLRALRGRSDDIDAGTLAAMPAAALEEVIARAEPASVNEPGRTNDCKVMVPQGLPRLPVLAAFLAYLHAPPPPALATS